MTGICGMQPRIDQQCLHHHLLLPGVRKPHICSCGLHRGRILQRFVYVPSRELSVPYLPIIVSSTFAELGLLMALTKSSRGLERYIGLQLP